MADTLDDIELRSDEVQEILTRVPHWMIRWGSALFLVLIFLVLGISWLVKYPDVIQTEAMITTRIPPQKEFARSTAKFDSIYVTDSQSVQRNTVLAILENPANARDVHYLKSILDTLQIKKRAIDFPLNEMPILLLGDIETAYANFENSYVAYRLNMALRPFDTKAVAGQASLQEQQTRLLNMRSQYSLNRSAMELRKNDLERNRSLLDKGVISQLDYENKQLELLNAERELKVLGAAISQTREAIANASKDVTETEIARTTEEAKLLRTTLQAYNQLKKAINDWENSYVLKSEIEGRVSFLNYWSGNQSVNQGDLVFTIIPAMNGDYIAKVRAAAQNSGKITVGQKVNIKLDNYPETEFGMLQGEVSSISQIPDKEGFYFIDVALPDKLMTSYQKEIEFKQEMSGVAEIITEDLRLLERFFYQFRQVFDQGK